jgi:hypothetical protein
MSGQALNLQKFQTLILGLLNIKHDNKYSCKGHRKVTHREMSHREVTRREVKHREVTHSTYCNWSQDKSSRKFFRVEYFIYPRRNTC